MAADRDIEQRADEDDSGRTVYGGTPKWDAVVARQLSIASP